MRTFCKSVRADYGAIANNAGIKFVISRSLAVLNAITAICAAMR